MNNQNTSKRVFAGIKVSDLIARECVKLQVDFGDLPARFIPPKDLHVTLLSPWQMTDQSEVIEKIHKAIQNTERFTLKLDHLSYAPSTIRPKIAWIECRLNEELLTLKKELLREFDVEDQMPFKPHVTIARFKREDYERLRKCPIEKPLALSMTVESVELFQSPCLGGRGYTVLASLPIPAYKIPH